MPEDTMQISGSKIALGNLTALQNRIYIRKRRLVASTDYFRRSMGPRPLRGATPRVDDPEPNPPIAVSTSSRLRRSEPLLNLPTPIFSPFSRFRVAGCDDVTSKTFFKVG